MKGRKKPLRRGAVLACLAAAGCQVGPAYHRPALDLPAAYTSAGMGGAPVGAAGAAWWHGFGAPELDRLEAMALAGSPVIAAAVARVVQADQAVRVAGAPLLPELSGTASQSWTREGVGQGQNGAFLAALNGGHRYTEIRSYSLELSAAYEVDFWGKNLDALQSAQALAAGSRFDRDTVILTTEASVANTFFQALGARDRAEIARRNLADQEQVLGAYRGRLAAGTASLLDVSQQEALVAATRAQIPALDSSFRQEVLALGILVGLPPERVTLTPAPLVSLAHPAIAPGLPAELLRRRPDVASAEAQLIAQNATVRADIAAFFPDLQLTAAGGLSSMALSTLTGPGTLLATLGSTLTQAIFDNGLRAGTLGEARGRYRELAADYAKSVLQALTDVETALTAAGALAEQEARQAEAVDAARRSAEIARAQLEAGTVDLITVLNTETTRLSDEDTLAQVRQQRFLALVSLYKALGGGVERNTAAGQMR